MSNIFKIFIVSALVLVFLSISKTGTAQKKINPEYYGDDTDSVPVYHYVVLRNRPDSVARLTYCFYPFGVAVNSSVNARYEAGCSYDVQKQLNLYAILSTTWNEGIYDAHSYPVTLLPYYNIEIGGNYYIFSKMLCARARTFFPLSPGASLSARFKRNHLIKIGIAASLGFANSAVTTDNVDLIGYNIKENGMEKIDFKKYLSPNLDHYTNAQMPYISIGLELERIKDVALVIDKTKESEASHKSRFYVCLLVTPYTHYDDIVITSPSIMPSGTYNVNTYSPRQYIGFRTGWDFCSLQKFGIAMGAEAGYMPNLRGYMNLKVGLAFSPERRH